MDFPKISSEAGSSRERTRPEEFERTMSLDAASVSSHFLPNPGVVPGFIWQNISPASSSFFETLEIKSAEKDTFVSALLPEELTIFTPTTNRLMYRSCIR